MSEKGSNNNFFIYLTTSFDCKRKPGVATDLDLPRLKITSSSRNAAARAQLQLLEVCLCALR